MRYGDWGRGREGERERGRWTARPHDKKGGIPSAH